MILLKLINCDVCFCSCSSITCLVITVTRYAFDCGVFKLFNCFFDSYLRCSIKVRTATKIFFFFYYFKDYINIVTC